MNVCPNRWEDHSATSSVNVIIFFFFFIIITSRRKWAELWAWIAANEGEADDAKHDETMPNLLLQSDGVDPKLRDETSAMSMGHEAKYAGSDNMIACVDRDRRENDRDRRGNDKFRRGNDKNRSDDRDCRDGRDRRENGRVPQDNNKNCSDERDCRDDRDRRENDRDCQVNVQEPP